VVSLVADLWSKHWAKSHFESIRPGAEKRLVVIQDAVSFIFAKNRGGAWGLLQNENEALRRPFFLVVSVAAIVFIVSLYRKLQPGQTALKWGLPLVLGGALGNLIDRIRYGYVVDFIDVFMKMGGEMKHWPTFNVADIAICVGVGLMAVDMFTSRKEHKKPAAVSAQSVTLSSRTNDSASAPAEPAAEPKPADGEDGGQSSPKTSEGT
jgi:signal peptidase II